MIAIKNREALISTDCRPSDLESAQWLRDLTADEASRGGAIERLHSLLLRVSRAEA